jgi:hypothetical protein
MRYHTTQAIRAYIGLYERWTYNKITIVLPLTNMYEKIFTIVMFNVPKKISREEHWSRSGLKKDTYWEHADNRTLYFPYRLQHCYSLFAQNTAIFLIKNHEHISKIKKKRTASERIVRGKYMGNTEIQRGTTC